MNFCSNCGKKINEKAVTCVNCGQKLKEDANTDYKNNESQINNIKKLKKSKVLSWISFVLAFTPILLFVGSALMAEPASFSGLFIYVCYAYSFPVIIVSLVCGIISYKIKNNNLAFIGILIDSIPFAFVVAVLVLYIITVILGLN